MLESVNGASAMLADPLLLASVLGTIKAVLLIAVGFSLVIFVHELGHFTVAKLAGVRVDRFAIGFGKSLFTYRRGIGFRWGSTEPEYRRRIDEHVAQNRQSEAESSEKTEPSDAEIAAALADLGLGETEYAFNVLPLGGYVKMLGQEDFTVDKEGEWKVKDDPRAFTNKPVGRRMLIVSAGVLMNIVFAALVFMVVFMIGIDFPTSVIGMPLPDTPAERAGLQFGDRIVEVNGTPIRDWNDIQMAVVLAPPHEPSVFKIERGGKILDIELTPENNPDRNILQIGVPPKFTKTIAYVQPTAEGPDSLKVDDEVLIADGKPVRDYFDLLFALQAAAGEPVTFEVERPDPADPARKTTTTCTQAARLQFARTGDDPLDPGHLLGFVPRAAIAGVAAESPAEAAGFKPGDVILQWTDAPTPTPREVRTFENAGRGRDYNVLILRGEERLTKTLRPKPTGIFRQGKPETGLDLTAQDVDHLVVADIVDKIDDRPTPAAKLKTRMPRGATLTKVNDAPVRNWRELFQRFIELAGNDVKITWQYESQPEQTDTIFVPPTFETKAGIPVAARIMDIDGKESVEVTKPDGKRVSYAVAHWRGAYEIVRRAYQANPNGEVTVRYWSMRDPERKIESCTIKLADDMLDPWTMRIRFDVPVLGNVETVLVHALNPVKALGIGVRKTYDFVLQAYMTMRRMVFDRTIGVEHISGPVGIIQIGIDIAELGVTRLLFFLGFISINLAVINFLPLPIVDGGLMVFLLIEKIKGRPVSVRTQVVTQIIGLALIIAVFVIVTFMDISKL